MMMAIQVQMTDNILKHKPKVIGPFTKSELIGILISAGLAIPTFLLTFKIDITLAIILTVVVALPPALAGHIEIDGTPLATIALRLFYLNWLTPSLRKYSVTPDLHEQYKHDKRKHDLDKYKTAKERKALEKHRVIYNTRDFHHYK